MQSSEIKTELLDQNIELKSLKGKSYKLHEWLTTYPLLLIALDPYTVESSWILDTGTKIFDHYNPADVRVGWICTTDEKGCKDFLGPLSDSYLTFADPERKVTKSFNLTTAPSLIHVRADGFTQISDGWKIHQWQNVLDWASKILAWSELDLANLNTPSSYSGTNLS